MSLASDLLRQAGHLATLEPKKPKQASLRRAVSAAYYAMFHLVVADGSRRLVDTPRLRPAVVRMFEHQQLSKAAKTIQQLYANPTKDHWLKVHLTGPISVDLNEVCSTFVDLQDRRHDADYDIGAVFTRGGVRSLVNLAHDAFVKWHKERGTENALVFLLYGAKLLRDR